MKRMNPFIEGSGKKKWVGIFYENNLKDPKQKIMAFTSNNTTEAINQYIMIRSLIKSNI